jgi:hypothetical protein
MRRKIKFDEKNYGSYYLNPIEGSSCDPKAGQEMIKAAKVCFQILFGFLLSFVFGE